jgi:hypothetical protein
MATSKNRTQRARPTWLKVLVVLFLAAAAIAWLYREPILGLSRTGASFGARTACSCRYVAGRDIEDCKKDFEPGMEIVFLSDDPDEKAVTAYVPLVASQTATYRQGYGCVLEPWDE